jgi:uncharacterized protein (DUF1501 family)
MKRRDFLKSSALASGALMVPSFLKAWGNVNPMELNGYRTMVIIQLSGGNDGLNTVVPYTNDIYYQNRPNIGVGANEVLKINDELGFNPVMKGMKSLYDDGLLSIINNVGYPNPDRSHFRSLDIWHSASNSNEYLSTGWMGRYLDSNCKHPYQVIEVDDTLSLAVKGARKTAIATKDPLQLYNTTRSPYFSKIVESVNKENLDEDNMGYLYKTMLETHSSADYIYETHKIYKSDVDYPNHKFAKQMKTIGEFIISGMKTRVYYISLGGFDTHVGQSGQQERLLETYSESVAALVKDLKKNNRLDDTLIMTFSEFGRRVKQNGSNGTDHGTANNLFVVGGKLKKAGVYNSAPNLADLDDNGDLKYDIDFRRVYATVLNNWLEVDHQKILNNRKFEVLDFI